MTGKIRFSQNVFIRHVSDESVLWCPRTGGCTVLLNAQPILREVTQEWRSINEIANLLMSKFGCGKEEVVESIVTVVEELASQKFVELREIGFSRASDIGHLRNDDEYCDNHQGNKDCEWTPLGDFYVRHELPCELHIDLTDGCNERCVHCYLPRDGSHYIDKGIVFKVLKEFREVQGLTVFVSGGECMLHKDFAEILHYAKSLDLNIIVLSNLTLCDDRMVALLKEVDPQFVNVSLYAVTDAVHDSITQTPGSCRKTKAAIDTLQAAGVHIRIATPFMRENKDCVEELKEYASIRHVHFVADSEIFGQIDHSCENQSHALSIGELEELLLSRKDIFAKSCIESDRCLYDAKVCDIGDARLNLDAEGKYYPCDGFHGAIIGDARKDPLWDVWTGEALNRLRALKNKDFGSCASCADRAWCKVCLMRNYNETGNMFTHAPWRCDATRLYRRIFEEK